MRKRLFVHNYEFLTRILRPGAGRLGGSSVTWEPAHLPASSSSSELLGANPIELALLRCHMVPAHLSVMLWALFQLTPLTACYRYSLGPR